MLTSSRFLLYCLICFIIGVFIASFFDIPKLIFYEFIFLGVFYSLFFFKKRLILCFGVCLLFLSLGVFKGGQAGFIDYDDGHLPFVKERLQNVIDKSLSPPQSSILAAILLGNKQEIGEEFGEKLNRAGIRHITAVSGLHIVVISGLLLYLGLALGLHKGHAFYFALVFLWLFILMIGFQPSAVRAGVMGSAFLFCEKIGRQKKADRVIFLTAGIMLFFNPSLLRYSVGFQLSFLASLGIIYLMPFFQKLLRRFKFKDLLAMSFSAQVFTFPVLVYHFGQISLISPITNLFVVPVLPYLMAFGFIFVIFGVIFFPLTYIFIFFVWVLLTYIVKITELFSRVPPLQFNLHWFWLVIIYSLLFVFVWRRKKDFVF